MTELHQKLRKTVSDTLLPIIGDQAERIHLIDPPDHANVGDCAILLGELDFLQRELPGSRIAFTDWRQGLNAPGAIDRSSVLLIHGGGNFGDIWPHHHNFRLDVLRAFRHRKIIQMPQSIHFDSPVALKETQDAIAAHPDFTLVARDKRSEAFAREHFDCQVALCPDMAFGMEPIHRKPPRVDAFCLLRTDKELLVQPQAIKRAIEAKSLRVDAEDWLDDPASPALYRDKAFRVLARKAPWSRSILAGAALSARRAYATARLERGIDLLSRGRIVVTDRLHAHILSTLLDIPNLVFNSYDAKATAMYETWTNANPLCRLVGSPDELPGAIDWVLEATAQKRSS